MYELNSPHDGIERLTEAIAIVLHAADDQTDFPQTITAPHKIDTHCALDKIGSTSEVQGITHKLFRY